jgi:hypothetical protein
MRFTTLCLLFFWAVLASAQLYPNKLGLVGSNATKLGELRVQFELQITEAQKSEISDTLGSHSKAQVNLSNQLGKAKQTEYPAIQAQLEKLELATSKQILQKLTTKQRQRLWQLSIQDAGPFSLRNGEVAKMVGLTPDQRSGIEALASKVRIASDELNAKMGAEIEAAGTEKKRSTIVKNYQPKLSAVESKGEIEVLAMLSKVQMEKWKKAKGKPFKF